MFGNLVMAFDKREGGAQGLAVPDAQIALWVLRSSTYCSLLRETKPDGHH